MLVAIPMDVRRSTDGLNPAQWGRIRDIFEKAVALSPDARASYVEGACAGDAALRAEVDSLLLAASGSAWLDRPVIPGLADGAPALGDTVTMESPAESGSLALGQRLGPYQIVQKIGEGGMGAVYRATDQRLNRTVAIKVIARSRGGEVDRKRFFLEAKAASALNHPNIVTIYEYDSKDGLDYMVMEYIQGATLDRLLGERQTPLPELLGYACQVACAVEKAHRAGIVHRDLKPNNIMVTAEGAVKVLDFGLAKQAAESAGAEGAETLTRTGVTIGTPAYMSPEQAKGQPADHRSDIFSLGVILYEMASGCRPFEGANAMSMLHAIAHEEPLAPEAVVPGTPRQLAALIERCLVKDKEGRPQSMEEVRSGLLAVLSQAGSGNPRPAIRGRRRMLAAAVALLAVLTATVWRLQRPAAMPRRVLTWSLVAQKPGGEPYQASSGEIFRGGDRFRLRIESTQTGFFYAVNEGAGKNGRQRFWILYPREGLGVNEPANHAFETGWYGFDENPGTERLWILWAEQPLATIEEALGTAESGEVRDSAQTGKVQSFLDGLGPATKTTAAGSKESVRLVSQEATLASLIDLRHQ